MPVRVVESKDNARLKELRRALAQPARARLAGIEGPHLVEEALRSGLRVATIFAARDFADNDFAAHGAGRAAENADHRAVDEWLNALALPPETEVLLLPRRLLASALTTETPQPIAALVEPKIWSWANLLGQNQKKTLLIVLAGVQDPGNLGTILRSTEAFGVAGVVSLPGTVSAWNPKAVRASAGSVFRVPLVAADEEECVARLRAAGVRLFATAVQNALPAGEADLAGAAALLIGNEGNGVAAELAAEADQQITIPCPGPVESLNAAVAASILLYEAARQRRAASGRVTRPKTSLAMRLKTRSGARR